MTDVPLLDQDQVTVYRADEKALPALAVVEGAVVHPANYRITVGMRVSDVLFAAGGLQRDAAQDAAHLYRQVSPTEVKLIRIKPALALQHDQQSDLQLQADDRLVIYRQRDIAFTPEKVNVVGEVQRPGEYHVYQGMTLYDLLLLAGGATEQAGGAIEITAPPGGERGENAAARGGADRRPSRRSGHRRHDDRGAGHRARPRRYPRLRGSARHLATEERAHREKPAHRLPASNPASSGSARTCCAH